tara:strand:- start:1285 stop:2265 length:981 start_codon:yes stop_codon:yes gene_type:complete
MNTFRPEIFFEDIVGQDYAINLLTNAIKKKKIAPAYLFIGPEGVGIKLTALRFLEAFINTNCTKRDIRKRLENRNHQDLLWIEPGYLHQGKVIPKSIAHKEKINQRAIAQIRLDQIKSINNFLSKKPLETSLGMVLIEGVETMNESAANALLKTLEEPNNGIFILITDRAETLLNTIRSRCQQINFNRLSNDYIREIFHNHSRTLKIEESINNYKEELIALANGSPGAVKKHIEVWENIPIELFNRLKVIPNKNPTESLSLAKDLSEKLDSEQQLWMINWLQQNIWLNRPNLKAINKLEKLRFLIQSFVSPRLAWEVTLIELNEAY